MSPVAQGFKAWGSLHKESDADYGDPTNALAGVARHGYFRVVPPESLDLDKSYYESPGTGTRICRGVHEGVHVWGGNVQPETNFEGGWMHFLRGWFGLYAFTANTDTDGSPQVGINRHAFQTQESLDFSYIMELSRGDIPAGQVFRYKGVMMDTMELTVQQDALLGADFGVICQVEDGAARVAAPTYPAEYPIKNVYYNPSYAANVAVALGSNVATLQRATIRGENKLERRPNLGILTAKPIPGDSRMITAELLADFEDRTHYDKFKNETEGNFALSLSGPIVAGASRQKVVMTATTAHGIGGTPAIESKGLLRIPIKMRFIKTDPEFKIVIGNAQATL